MHQRCWSISLTWLSCLLLVCTTGLAFAMAESDPAVAALHAKYASLTDQLHQNQFERPLVLDSAETPEGFKGDIYALVDYPFEAVNVGLNNPDHWCDLLLLHINTKYCHAVVEPSGTTLRVNLGRKTPTELANSTRIELRYSVAAATSEHIEIILNAKNGPQESGGYRILLEAVALPNDKTFLHLSYSYATNIAERLALQLYLKTIGRGKVGFTVIGTQDDGQPDYIGGARGMVERNTMRYYLAIETFLGAAQEAPAAQLESRLQGWFTAVEQYPRQLHEMDRGEYLEMKRSENLRQQIVY